MPFESTTVDCAVVLPVEGSMLVFETVCGVVDRLSSSTRRPCWSAGVEDTEVPVDVGVVVTLGDEVPEFPAR